MACGHCCANIHYNQNATELGVKFTMEFKEAFTERVPYGLGIQEKISGFLYVSENVSYMVAEEGQESDGCILVCIESLSEKMLDQDIPVAIGTMVLYAGKATICGTFLKSGMPLLPVAVTQVSQLSFEQGSESYEIKVQ